MKTKRVRVDGECTLYGEYHFANRVLPLERVLDMR